MFIVYIIYSNKTDKYYIGTTDDFNKRLEEHNNAFYPNAYTRKGEPWILKKCFCCEFSKEAYFMERFIKRMKSRDFIEKIINDSSLFYEIMKAKMWGFSPEVSGPPRVQKPRLNVGVFCYLSLVNWLPPFTRKLNPREFILLGFFVCNNLPKVLFYAHVYCLL